MDQATKEAFAKLTTTVERQSDGLAELTQIVEDGFAAVAEDIADMRARMVTKEKLQAFREETAENFHDLKAEVADIRRAIERLQARVDNMEGYSKEIDHLLERLRVIEKHLGIDTRVAA